ncbi:MAG: IS200/IS605 family transposase [Chloroflexota bacterium]
MKLKNPVKKYHAKGGTVFSCQYHVVWCPKYRRNVLEGDVADYLEQFILEMGQQMRFEVIDLEIQSDYVHLLLDVDPKMGIASLVKKIKYQSALALRTQFPELKSRLPSLWTRNVFISTVGTADTIDIQDYLDDQKGK